jgi:cation:H+ antiporter
MIVASIAMWAMAANGTIAQWEGAILFVALISYVVFCIWKSRSENKEVLDEFASEYSEPVSGTRHVLTNLGLFLAGLVLLGIGSKWLVAGAVTIATWMGVSKLVIGLTIVAIGTSLPEVVTSIVASYRGERDIAVGNVVGSNLFNILCVLGLTSVVSKGGVPVSPDAVAFDIPVMVAVAVICLPIFLSGSVIRRYEGALFLVYYAAYTTFILLAAMQSSLQKWFGTTVLVVVLPLTVLTLGLSFYQGIDRSAESDPNDAPADRDVDSEA